MTADKQPRRLGRGLDALIPSAAANATSPAGATPGADLQRVPIARIRPNPYQPRREFDPAELAELAASLKASGLLQPITVRRRGDAYELVTGERRLRAATSLGWTEIQAIVRDLDEQTMLVVALIENLQRTDLNAIEEARGYRRLIDEFHLTQQQVADGVGKDRTTVTNLLRVLSLPAEVQELVAAGDLSAGHARALLALDAPHSALELARSAVADGFSVRELERRVRALMQPAPTPPTSPQLASSGTPIRRESGANAPTDPVLRQLEDQLRRYLQTDVHIQTVGEAKGTVRISFYSSDDLDRVLDLILRDRRDAY